MAIIKFSNGQTVNFNGDPTQQDIETVARKMGIYEKAPEAEPDFLEKAGAAVNSIFPGKKIGEAIGAGLYNDYQAIKTGDLSKVRDTSGMPTVKELAGDTAKIAALVGGAALPVAPTILGKAAQFGTIGAVSGAGQAALENESFNEILKQSGKEAITGAAVGTAFGLVEKGIKQLGNLLGRAGDKIQFSVIKPSQADIKDGFSLDTVKKYDLGGSLKKTFSKTDSTLDDLSKQLNAKLGASNTSLDLNNAYEKTAKKLLGSKLESFGSNSQMEGAVEKLRNEILAVSADGKVSIPEAQIVKRAAGHFGAWTYGVPTPEATASQKVYNTFYNELKTAIEEGSPVGVKEINKEISKLIPVMNAVIRRIPVAERNAAISLTDIISLSTAALDPSALSVAVVNRASKSGAVGRALSKTPNIVKPVTKGVRDAERVVRTLIQN